MTEPTPQRTASIVASNLVDPPVNPNHVSPEGQLELERAIRRHGFNQPILVRPLKGKGKKALDKYEIIDGCHRRNAMVAIYGPDVLIPAIVVECTDAVATQLQIGMNRLRGELDQAAVGRLVQGLLDNVSKADLAIGYSVEEIDQILAIAKPQDFNAVGDVSLPPPAENTAPSEAAGTADPGAFKLELSFQTQADLARVKRVLRAKAGGKNDFGAGLINLIDSKE